MPNKTIKDDVVKWPSKKKYTCKRNKGEHEWDKPVIKYEPDVRYIYETESGMLDASELLPEYELTQAEVSVVMETRCKHCGKKVMSYLRDKLV